MLDNGIRSHIFLLLDCFIRSIKNRAEETSINCALIDNDRIFLVVTGEARNRDDGVRACRNILRSDVLQRFTRSECDLRVVENMAQCIHSHVEVR